MAPCLAWLLWELNKAPFGDAWSQAYFVLYQPSVLLS